MGDRDAKIWIADGNKLHEAVDSMLGYAILAHIWDSDLCCARGNDVHLAFCFQ